jgi:hypothetical protein
MKNFDDAPFLVIWELTQACDACVHCRASAIERRNPLELTTEEGFRLLDEIRSLGDPLMVFTGGDPLKRPDLFPLLQRSVSLGLRTTVTLRSPTSRGSLTSSWRGWRPVWQVPAPTCSTPPAAGPGGSVREVRVPTSSRALLTSS